MRQIALPRGFARLSIVRRSAPRAADDLSELRERLEAQEQKIRVLERKLELQDEATKAAVPNTPVVRASPQQGFRIQSADAANVAARCAACCISTVATSPTTSRRRPRTPGSCAACGRRSKAR